jgi:voltage-gated potassium channel
LVLRLLGHDDILAQDILGRAPGGPPGRTVCCVAELGTLFEDDAEPETRVAFPSRRLSARESLLVRVAIALGCLLLTAGLVYGERDGYSDSSDSSVSALDALYYATVTLSTTGYGDITPVSDLARLTNIFVITPLRFVFLIVLVSTTVEVLTQAARERSRVNRWRKRMKDHTVIVGFGVKGQAALRTLLAHGQKPDTLVVIADDRYSVAEATRQGVTGVVGDARSERVLRDAGVPTAARIIIAADQDDTAIMVTLLVKKIAAQAGTTPTIVAAAREAAAADLIRHGGADRVIVHAESAGNLMGLSLLSSNVGEIVEDLMNASEGLEIVERDISRAELGLAPSDVQREGELVLAVVRDGQAHKFDEGGIRVLQKGDRIVVIRRTGQDSAESAVPGKPPGAVPRPSGTSSLRPPS